VTSRWRRHRLPVSTLGLTNDARTPLSRSRVAGSAHRRSPVRHGILDARWASRASRSQNPHRPPPTRARSKCSRCPGAARASYPAPRGPLCLGIARPSSMPAHQTAVQPHQWSAVAFDAATAIVPTFKGALETVDLQAAGHGTCQAHSRGAGSRSRRTAHCRFVWHRRLGVLVERAPGKRSRALACSSASCAITPDGNRAVSSARGRGGVGSASAALLHRQDGRGIDGGLGCCLGPDGRTALTARGSDVLVWISRHPVDCRLADDGSSVNGPGRRWETALLVRRWEGHYRASLWDVVRDVEIAMLPPARRLGSVPRPDATRAFVGDRRGMIHAFDLAWERRESAAQAGRRRTSVVTARVLSHVDRTDPTSRASSHHHATSSSKSTPIRPRTERLTATVAG